MNATASFQIKILEDVETEPVTVAEQKKFSFIDSDYASNDDTLEIIIASAREKLEGALNVFLAPKKVEVQYSQGLFALPYGPTGDVDSVTKSGDTVPLDPSKYEVLGLEFKSIALKEYAYCGVTEWFYPVWGGYPIPWNWNTLPADFTYYNVVYTTGYEVLPKLLKHCILMLADYMIKEQGSTELEIPPAIMGLANRFSRNLVIQ